MTILVAIAILFLIVLTGLLRARFVIDSNSVDPRYEIRWSLCTATDLVGEL